MLEHRQQGVHCPIDEVTAVVAHLDLHARLGKRAGAWMSVAVPRRGDREPGLPVAQLVCNFPPRDEQGVARLFELTARLREVGALCGINVLDHVVVAADGFVSLAEQGWL